MTLGKREGEMAKQEGKEGGATEPWERAENLEGPVYKFRSFDAARDSNPDYQGGAASLLRDNLIYCASPWDMNDLWEGRPSFRVPTGLPDSPEVRAFAKVFGDSLPESDRAGGERWLREHGIEAACRLMQDSHYRDNKDVGIYSVSASVELPLQWSYYANGHRGYAWVFDNKSRPFSVAAKVYYEKECPTINWATWRRDNVLKASFLTKADHWLHEQEYRVILPRTSAPHLFDVVPYAGPGTAPMGRYLRIPPGALLGVVFGVGAPRSIAGSIVKMAREYGRSLQFYKCGIHRDKFEVVAVDISPTEYARLLDAH
jgi:hypothetical protein